MKKALALLAALSLLTMLLSACGVSIPKSRTSGAQTTKSQPTQTQSASDEKDFEYELVYDDDAAVITKYVGAGGDVVVPPTIADKPVIFICADAFEDCISLTSITIPDSVTDIGRGAFEGTAWYDQHPDGLIYIGNMVYAVKGDCPESVDIRNGTVSINRGVFEDCTSLKSVTIPGSVTIIGDDAFAGCTSLTSLIIPDGVTRIGWGACSGCTSLTSVTIPNSVTTIGGSAFDGCTSLKDVTIPDSVTDIGEYGGYVFHNCTALTSVTISNSVRFIGDGTFLGCTSLTSVTIPNSVTSIGERAFYGCTSLKSATIPASVISIGERAFTYCESLTTVYYGGSEADRAKMDIDGTNNVLHDATWVYAS